MPPGPPDRSLYHNIGLFQDFHGEQLPLELVLHLADQEHFTIG